MKKALALLTFILLWVSYSIGQQLITNGNFSSLYNGWGNSGNWYVSNAFSCSYSSPAYAYVGNASGGAVNNAFGNLYQTITIPANATAATLSYYVSINTDETTTTQIYDYIQVYLTDLSWNILTSTYTYSNLLGTYGSTGCQAYQFHSFSIPSNLFGQTMNVVFHTYTDAAKLTKFRVDDVSLIYTPCTLPPAPTGLTANAVSSSQINLTWNSVTGATNYEVDYGLGNCPWGAGGSYLTTTNCNTCTSTMATGLTPNTTYRFIVIAKNSCGWGTTFNCVSTTTLSGTTYGSVNVTIFPSAAVTAGAQWNIDGGSWQNSGTTLNNIVTGNHTINFKNVSGWITPPFQYMSVSAGNTSYIAGTYTQSPQYGSVNVSITPPGAISAGAQWNIDGGSWQNSGVTLNNVVTGNHTINFKTVTGWTTPSNQSINITNGNTTYSNGTYTLIPAINQYAVYNVLPYTVFPFSNPYPLANGLTSSPASVIKICADGSQATKLSYVNNDLSVNSNNIRFWIASDPYGNHVDTTGYFLNPYSVAGNTISAVYAHPKYLSDFNLPYRKDTIFVVDYTNPSIPKFKIPIRVYRAPILFIHGLKGDVTSFQLIPQDLQNSNYYPSSLVTIADYHTTSLQGFATNSNVVSKWIYEAFYKSISNKYSIGKVDIVSHSMGGILSRLYLQSNYGNSYKEDINKLITINSPHSGSHFANWAVFSPVSIALCAASPLFHSLGFACNGGAVDMQTYSYATDNILNSTSSLNKGHVPSHTISSYINNSDVSNCVGSLNLFLLNISPSDIPFIFGFGQQMDGVVRVDSQKGGLNGLQTSSVIYQCHLGAQNNATNKDDIKQLLCAKPDAGQFSLNGFNPPNLRQSRPKFSRDVKSLQSKSTSLTSFVAIVTPTNSSVFVPNQQITITIDSDTSVKRMIILAGNTNIGVTIIDTVITSTTTSVSYTIPSNAIGTLEIDVVGLDPINFLASDSVTFSVNANAILESLEINPSIILLPTGFQNNFQVIGHYSDSIPRDITLISGVQFNVFNTGVAQVISPGLIEGISVDSTQLEVSYQGISDTIPVYVYNGDSLSHALFSSNTNVVCDSGYVTFNNISSGQPISIQWSFPGGLPANSTDSIPIVYYNTTGVFDVSLVAYYPTKTDTLFLQSFITVEASPSSTLSYNNDTIFCSNSTAYEYQWYHNGNIVDSSFQYFIVPDSMGYYYVEVMSETGCISISDSFYYAPSGIAIFLNNRNISIYPNPASTLLHLVGEIDNDYYDIIISNVLGQVVFTKEINVTNNLLKTQINIENLPKGVYSFVLKNNKSIYQKKILKQ